MRAELGPVVTNDQAGPAAPGDECRQFPRHAATRDRGVEHSSQAFLRDIVDHVEDPEPPTLGELVVEEVDRPKRVRRSHSQERRSRASRLLPPPPLAHRQVFLAVEPLVFAVDDMTLPPHQNMQPPVTEHARRSLISWRSTRIATASRLVAAFTTFATGRPSAQPSRVATPLAAAST